MKKFLKTLLLFILPIIVLSYFIDVFISTNLKKSRKYAESELCIWNDVFGGKINSDIVVYGSSRATDHINPTEITKKTGISCYNLGVEGSNFFLQNLRHKIFLAHNKKPKVIIYSLDMFTTQKKAGIFNSVQLLPYMLWNKEIEKTGSMFEGYNYFDYNLPLVRYYGQLEAFEKSIRGATGLLNNPIGKIRGYQGKDKKWNGDFDRAKKKMKKYIIQKDPKITLEFEKFINECSDSKIQLLFIYTPEYIEGQQFVENREEIMMYYQNISNKYGIPFYDFSKNPICYNKNYFYNANHLNKAGAELFTSKLIDTLIKSKILIPNKIISNAKN